MSQSDTPRRERRIEAHTVVEGQRVFMGINFHGSMDGKPGTEYDSDLYQAGVEGTVVEAPRESEREMLKEGGRPMADLAVETDDGTVYRWNVDNGYVLGPSGDRRTDIGKIGGFYQPAE